uniref:Uncharacterized protein n=1 Tax=Timema shepardi TaxID=629360 RepID=A0A7R9B841_TIMSH|nr:unnamed protein product [Timema shepardi]
MDTMDNRILFFHIPGVYRSNRLTNSEANIRTGRVPHAFFLRALDETVPSKVQTQGNNPAVLSSKAKQALSETSRARHGGGGWREHQYSLVEDDGPTLDWDAPGRLLCSSHVDQSRGEEQGQ